MKIISAKEGMWLTQSHIEDEATRIFSNKVYNPTEDWRDATDAEKEQWEESHPIELPEGMMPRD